MIDSIELVWGGPRAPDQRRAHAIHDYPSPPVYLDVAELVDRLGSPNGERKRVQYDGKWYDAGHWKQGDVQLLVSEGRVELRASLPKVVVGRNDVVLDEAGVHEGLRELVRRGADLTRAPLELREAVPKRVDFAFQWEVPSVAFTLEHIKSAYHPARKRFTENISPRGGRSLVWGYGHSKKTIRFYDKRAEVLEHMQRSGEFRRPRDHKLECRCPECVPPDLELDTLLRFEIQDRRRPGLRALHVHGYSGRAVATELAGTIESLGAVAFVDAQALLDGRSAEGISNALRSLYLGEHPEWWPPLRKVLPRTTFYRWRREARLLQLGSAEWVPRVPEDAFTAGSNLWTSSDCEAA